MTIIEAAALKLQGALGDHEKSGTEHDQSKQVLFLKILAEPVRWLAM